MYCINDKQIDYILNDIRARGVDMEDLQNNLLDHICCIIEQNLEEEGDFERFYSQTIQTFYKDELWEIEEETLQLLTFKHYYAMKKTMLNSGIFAAFSLSLGLILKFLHLPGAAVCIILGIGSAAFLFLPLLFTLKAKEKQGSQEKITMLVGGLACSLISLSILFKIMHWPFANMMGGLALLMLLFVFVPIFLINGIRNPETKVNTITSSILIVLGCGLVFTLYRSPKGSENYYTFLTQGVITNEHLLNNERNYLKLERTQSDSSANQRQTACEKIYQKCEELKSIVLKDETGFEKLDAAFETKKIIIEEHRMEMYLSNNSKAQICLKEASSLINDYNTQFGTNTNYTIPTKHTIFEQSIDNDAAFSSSTALLNQITQVQLFALQHQKN
jgi:hypothetical protein